MCSEFREARHQLLTNALHDPNYDCRTNVRSMAALRNVFRSTPQSDDRLALILSQEAERLQALDWDGPGAAATMRFKASIAQWL